MESAAATSSTWASALRISRRFDSRVAAAPAPPRSAGGEKRRAVPTRRRRADQPQVPYYSRYARHCYKNRNMNNGYWQQDAGASASRIGPRSTAAPPPRLRAATASPVRAWWSDRLQVFSRSFQPRRFQPPGFQEIGCKFSAVRFRLLPVPVSFLCPAPERRARFAWARARKPGRKLDTEQYDV